MRREPRGAAPQRNGMTAVGELGWCRTTKPHAHAQCLMDNRSLCCALLHVCVLHASQRHDPRALPLLPVIS